MKTVVCTYCNSEIYTYNGPEDKIELKAKHFAPISSAHQSPQPGQDPACPVCGVKFTGYSIQGKQLRMIISSAYYGSGGGGTL